MKISTLNQAFAEVQTQLPAIQLELDNKLAPLVFLSIEVLKKLVEETIGKVKNLNEAEVLRCLNLNIMDMGTWMTFGRDKRNETMKIIRKKVLDAYETNRLLDGININDL